jgi:RNA polymerase sigma-70 factor (ECF subfamily)
MVDSEATRPSLLARIRDPQDRQAWQEFVQIYAPLVYRFAQKRGLQDADAADVTQEVLRAVARAAPRLEYDPARGSFRGWLFTIVRNELRDFASGQRRRSVGSGDTDQQRRLEQFPAPDEGDEQALWDREFERQLFTWAAGQVRGDFQESTWRAFWLTAVEGKSGKEAARVLGLTAAGVYLAKRRVMVRIKEEIERHRAE